jgi:hypothetical protein
LTPFKTKINTKQPQIYRFRKFLYLLVKKSLRNMKRSELSLDFSLIFSRTYRPHSPSVSDCVML